MSSIPMLSNREFAVAVPAASVPAAYLRSSAAVPAASAVCYPIPAAGVPAVAAVRGGPPAPAGLHL